MTDMAAWDETEPTNLYLSLVISVGDEDREELTLPQRVEATSHHGEAALVLEDAVDADVATLGAPYQQHMAKLLVPGALARRVAVEVDVRPWSRTQVELSIVPRRGTWFGRIGQARYLEAAEAVLEALADTLVSRPAVGAGRAA